MRCSFSKENTLDVEMYGQNNVNIALPLLHTTWPNIKVHTSSPFSQQAHLGTFGALESLRGPRVSFGGFP